MLQDYKASVSLDPRELHPNMTVRKGDDGIGRPTQQSTAKLTTRSNSSPPSNCTFRSAPRLPYRSPLAVRTPAAPHGQEISDRDVLLVLYQETGGPSWHNDAGWTSDLPLSEWFGVTANSEGSVVVLELRYNNLRGTETFLYHTE